LLKTTKDLVIMNFEAIKEEMKPLISQHWCTWFSTRLPVLSNQTPNEAAETVEGRKLLDILLAFYDSIRPRSDNDVNIPSNYAKWKLGYGTGCTEDYLREEAIMKFKSSNRLTKREVGHTRQLEKKLVSIFVPKRCERVGCDKKDHDDVQACAKCKCVYYCGRDHQKQDWSRHKLDCNAITLSKVHLHAKQFFFSRELVKYPLGCFPIAKCNDKETCCFICSSTRKEVEITYTECCKLPICDNSNEYQINSHALDFCHRSHKLFTTCSSHHEAGHEGDWRDCDECNKLKNGARPFSSTNGFCATPCFEKFLPQGTMLTHRCQSWRCENRMLPGHGAVMFYGGKTSGSWYCAPCSEVGFLPGFAPVPVVLTTAPCSEDLD
jgi:hypothetical protein